ncbi:unnamed protein product [Cylicocyclus nassatus]|uniref:RNA-directed DNA polymerase n=1 Tax=Cylicocyclus nassatus TaxID=53992 RepID=A0AA36H5A4_CYLNA|nr:unnamed protein product [Cylicocyclus nassatus]
MPPPTTRARAPSSDTGAHPQFSKITPSAPAAPQVAAAVSASLAHVVDDGPVTGRDVKELRDVTAQAITDVWTDSRQATANLAGKINATNASLLADLNESFSAMGHRIDGLPSAVNITTPIPIPSLPSFSGLDEDPTQFSAWLARVEDIFDMLSPPLSSAMKAKLQALDTADAVEQHLAGTISDRLITPLSVAPLEVKTVNLRPTRPSFRIREPQVSRRSNSFQGRRRSRSMVDVISRFNTDRTVCYSCGGLGHMAHQCPSQRQQLGNTAITLPLTIFHNLVLTNLSEITQDHQLTEVWSTVNQEHFLRLDHPTSPYRGTLQQPTSDGFSLLSLVFGVLKSLVVLYCKLYYSTIFDRLPLPAHFRSSSNASATEAVANRAICPVFSNNINTFHVDLSKAEVTDEERQQLQALFEEFSDRISHDSYDLGSYEHSQIDIRTTTNIPPTRFRPPRIPVKFQKELDEHINKLLRAGRIVESDTPWIHNTVLVKKRDGSLRVCLDFRPLNEITIPDHFPLPGIEDILAKISGHRYYTTLDLASGYMQLLLSPESQEKCGWATHRGIYQFVYLPFGLKNAGAYFSRAMSRILAGLEDNCLAYLDDIVVFNSDFPSHLSTLRKVFYRFRIYNIKASGKKLSEIARTTITFLGHEISGRSYSPAERNLRAIQDFPTPTSIKEVKAFVGMANFFRKFIPNFSLIATPLYALLKANAKFTWEAAQKEAFSRLKTCLLSKPCLAFPQDKEFFLHTDGSQVAVGAALFQQASDSDHLVAVGYFSKALSDSQRKWSPTHIELFAIISALRFFRAIIYGNHTTIYSDHRPLTFLLTHNKTHDNLARWVVELQSYDITIKYHKGSSNVVADALSRSVDKHVRFEDDAADSTDIIEFPVSINCCAPPTFSVRPPIIYLTQATALRPYDALLEQKSDAFCSPLMTFLETQRFPDNLSDDEKVAFLKLAEQCVLRSNGCLYHVHGDRNSHLKFERLVVPEKLREPVFIAFHSSPSAGGHFNWRKTLTKIARKYYWPHMSEDVFSLARSCEACQRKRAQQLNRELLITVSSQGVFEKVYIDLTGPFHTSDSGNKYIVAMIDHFTKYVVAAPLPDCTAVTVAQAVMTECILKYGAMRQLISDNASYFKGEDVVMIRVDLTRGHLAMDDLSPQQQLEALVAHALARDENPDATQQQQEQASDTSSSVMQNVYLDYPEEALLASDVESMNLSPASSLTLTASPPPGPSTDTQNLLIVPVPSTEEAKWTTVRDKPPTSTPSGSPHGSTRRRRASSPLFAEEMLHEEPLAVPSSSSYHDHPFDIPAQPIQDDIVSLRERLFNTDMQGVSLLRPGTRPPIKHVLTPQRRPPPTFTPEGHSHYLIEHHPWAHLVSPRPIDVLQSRAIQPVLDLPTEEYRHLPSGGYRNTHFARSLFPRIAIRAHCPVLQIPFIELQHLEDTIAFRDRTLRMIEDLQDGTYDDFREIDSPVQPDRLRCMLAPETWRGRRPVLPNKEERERLLDRADRFDNFESDHSVALIKMLKLFNVTGAAHAALPFLSDDHQTHWVAAVVPSLTVYTIRLNFVLHNMANEAGWAAQRPVAVWIAGSASLAFVRVRSVTMDPDQRTLAISTEAYQYSHRSILGDVAKHARRVGPNLVVDVGVHLIKSPLASNPVYESISRADLSITAPAGTFGDGVMNAMYGRARIGCSPRHSQGVTEGNLRLGERTRAAARDGRATPPAPSASFNPMILPVVASPRHTYFRINLPYCRLSYADIGAINHVTCQ